MTTRVTVAGHPIHAMLVTLPIGLWVFALAADIIYASTGDTRWEVTAYFCVGGGIIGALLAAIPGLVDLLGLHEGTERRTGITHMTINLLIVVLQVVNFWMRGRLDISPQTPMLLSVVAVAALFVSGWLGGQLVHVLGVTQPHHGEHHPGEADRLHPRT